MKELNCKGMLCPMPIVTIVDVFQELKVNELLKVTATDPGIELDIRAWCDATGHELISIEFEEDKIIIILKKTK